MRRADIRLCVRITPHQKSRLLDLQRRLQEREDDRQVTERDVILLGIDRLEAYLDRLERDLPRRR